MAWPTWHPKSDDELRELIRGVWEGRILGTWQFEQRYAEQRALFPDFDSIQSMKLREQDGYGVFWSAPEAAATFASIPRPAAGYRERPERPQATQGATAAPPSADVWEILDWDEWKRIRALLGYAPFQNRS